MVITSTAALTRAWTRTRLARAAKRSVESASLMSASAAETQATTVVLQLPPRLLEQLREHRVAEGHVRVCVPAAAAMRMCQRHDDVAQREQAGADAFALGYGEVLGACGVKGGEAGDFGQALGRQRGRSSAFKSGGWPTGLVRARAL